MYYSFRIRNQNMATQKFSKKEYIDHDNKVHGLILISLIKVYLSLSKMDKYFVMLVCISICITPDGDNPRKNKFLYILIKPWNKDIPFLMF